MIWTPTLRDFIQSHINDDTTELLLAARRYADVDVPFAVEQIEARRRLKGKLPEWYANPDLIMGGRVPAEQCSSEQTARYKRSILCGDERLGLGVESQQIRRLCDMTGGMGVDFWYMSEGMEQAIYTERNETLCEIAKHNFKTLLSPSLNGGSSISANEETSEQGNYSLPVGRVRGGSVIIRCGDGQKLPIPSVDVIYLDPARRAGDGSRVYAMEDCEPNIVAWQDELLQHAKMVLVKLSPMVDLTDVIRKLHNVTDIYVVGVKNECKEVLVKQVSSDSQSHSLWGSRSGNEVQVHCVDFLTDRTIEYTFSLSDHTHRDSPPCSPSLKGGEVVGLYLYEPDVTLMKAQAFVSLCQRFPVRQLEARTHLMTSNEFISDFPGRIFEVKEQIPFSSKTLKRLKQQIPQVNIATRNFPLSADELRKKTGIRDGGDLYLFGAKVHHQGSLLLLCQKPSIL